MASLGSYIRSAARATFSAYRSVPIRWRLAGGSAALTFVILAAFAAIVGGARPPAGPPPVQRPAELRRRAARRRAQRQAALHRRRHLDLRPHEGLARATSPAPSTPRSGSSTPTTARCCATQDDHPVKGAKAPLDARLFADAPDAASGTFDAVRLPGRGRASSPSGRSAQVTPALRGSALEPRRTRSAAVELFLLLLGVLGGTVLALLAGLFVRARAMRPDRAS